MYLQADFFNFIQMFSYVSPRQMPWNYNNFMTPPQMRRWVHTSSSDFYPGMSFAPRYTPAITQLNYTPATNVKSAENYTKEKLHIPNVDMNGDRETANLVNQTLTEIYNRYKGNVPMPDTIVNYEKNIHGSDEWGDIGGFYASKYKFMALMSPEYKLEQITKQINTTKNLGEKSFSSWYQKGLKGDFSQIEFIAPEFQKHVIQSLRSYRANPQQYNKEMRQKLGKELQKLHATNQLLDHTPQLVIEHLYNKPENKNIIKNGGFKTMTEISKMTTAEQKQEFYKILEKLKSSNGNIYVDVDFTYKNSREYELVHEFGHFLHHTTRLQRSFENYDKQINFSETDAKIAASVSKQAQKSPTEFVAEVFAGVFYGKNYSQEVYNLYNKLNGPTLPVK